ncbi:hypothetical protein ACS0TY_027162 [Phlomoides rotata]
MAIVVNYAKSSTSSNQRSTPGCSQTQPGQPLQFCPIIKTAEAEFSPDLSGSRCYFTSSPTSYDDQRGIYSPILGEIL